MEHPSLRTWIRQRRELLDLTQEALAEQVGCAVQTIRAFEHGWRRPSRSMAERLAGVLGVPPDERAAFLQVARAPVEGPAEAPCPADEHREHLGRLAEQAAGQLCGSGQAAFLDRLDADLGRTRAALAWAFDPHGDDRAARVELGLRAASASARVWHARGHQAEGQQWIERGLALAEAGDLALSPAVTAAALGSAGWLARLCGERERALALLHRCVALYRGLGDKRGLADALDALGDLAIFDGDAVAATWFYEEGLTLRRGLGRPDLVSRSLNGLGHAAIVRGYYERAVDYFCESISALSGLDDRRGGALARYGLGEACLRLGDLERAGAELAQALAIFARLGNALDAALCLDLLGELQALRVLTAGACAQPALERAAQLWGAAEGQFAALAFQLSPPAQTRRETLITAAELRLGAGRFAAARAAGRNLSIEPAVALALGAARRG